MKNNNSIRVLYKKAGQTPEVKIIKNLQKLKEFIIKNNLEIILYDKFGSTYIICNNRKTMQNMTPNIALTFEKISGDLILITIDKKQREFKSLSQSDIMWYTNDLIKKSFNNT